jgi:hypothetical protein
MGPINTPALTTGQGGRQLPSSPSCALCASSATEPVATMQRHTVNADPWYRCQECEHVFTAGRPDDPHL